ncbi:MAG TPA: VCBS repeat-containing protein [Pyrinomonadaceae bacterium]|nr:VCBS repeat-containing protein [Pyrinomonadaceae bacterium]
MNKMTNILALCALLLLTFNCGASPGPLKLAGQSNSDRPLLKATAALAVGEQPGALELGDVDGDGILDLIVGFENGNGFVVMLGDGRGGFKAAPGSPFDAGMPVQRVAVGDVNNDRILDVAVTNHDSLTVSVLLGKRGGGFAHAPGSPFAALKSGKPHNHGLSFADFNGDGHLDITTSNNNDNSVSVLLGDGRGGFNASTGSPFPVGRAPYPHAYGDFNRDRNLDIVAPNINGENLSILLGDGRGRLTPAPASPMRVASRPFYAAVGDFNADGNPDIATSHDDITLLTILLGDGRGGFSPAPGSPLDLGQSAYRIAAADMDGDKNADLVVSGAASGGGVSVLLGDGRGSFRHAAGSPFATGRGAYSIAVGDLNRDGKTDIVTANSESGNLSVLLHQ